MSAKHYRTLCCTFAAFILAASHLLAAENPVKLHKKVRRVQTISTGNPIDASENGGYGGMDILLSEGPATEDISITFTVSGTATANTDYYTSIWTGTTTLFAGESYIHLPLEAINDDLIEGDEDVVVTITGATGLSSAAAYALDPHITETMRIIDNDNVITAYPTTGQAGEPSAPITAKFALPGTLTAPEDITINYYVDGGTATNGVDYQTPPGQIILPAGSNYVILTIPVIDDKTIEGNETVKITMSSATAAGFNVQLSSSRSVSSSILDDDSELSIGIVGTINGKEKPTTSGAFTISLPPGVKAGEIVTVVYSISGTAAAGSDYKALTGKAFISAGKSSILVPITMYDDQVIEGDEDIVITVLSGSSNNLATYAISTTDNTTTVHIEDDDNVPANCQINAITVADGSESSGDGSFKLALPGTYTFKQDMSVTYQVSGTALPGMDYTTLSGTATLVAGQNSVLIPVPVLNDALIEGDESVIIKPQPVTSGGINFAGGDTCVVMILDDDDDNLKVSVSAYDPSATEPTDTAAFRLSLPNGNAASVPVTVTYQVGGTAANGTDYTSLTGTVTIEADSTGAFIPLEVLDDNLIEGDETVTIKLLTVTSTLPFTIDHTKDSAAITIDDDDVANMDIIAGTSVKTGAEPATNGQFTVSIASGKITSVPITVTYTTAGTATSGTDYTALPGTVTIAANSSSATVDVPVKDDNLVEGDETVIMTLTNATAGLPFIIGAHSKDTVIIDDDDDVNMGIIIEASIPDAEEPATNGEFTVKLASGKTPLVPITVTYTVSGTAVSGTDFTPLSGTVTIPANSTSITFPVKVMNDTIAETAETVIVTLNTITSTMPFVKGAADKDTVIIYDDDTEQVIISASDPDAAEPSDGGQFTIRIASGKPVTADVVLDLTITGTATNGTDYASIPLTITIPNGSSNVTIPVTVIDDNRIEGKETVIITLTKLTSAVKYDIGKLKTDTVTIADEDAANLAIEMVATKADAAEPGDGPTDKGEFTVRLVSGKLADKPITVQYEVGGSAQNAIDYDSIPAQVVIPAGSNGIKIPITVIDDTKPEGIENIALTINKITGYLAFTGLNSSATVQIADNDTVTTAAWMSTDVTGKVSSGNSIRYTIHVSNGSDTDQVNVIIKDVVPTYTVFVSAEDGIKPDASGLLTWVIPRIAPGVTITRELLVKVADDLTGADSIVNTATIDLSDGVGDQPVHPADPLNPNYPNLNSGPNDPATVVFVNKSGGFNTWKTVKNDDNTSIAKPAQELLYRIYIRNTGGVQLANVTIVDTIPAHTKYVSNATGGVYNAASNTISWTRATIGVKVKDSVSFLVRTDDDLSGVTQIENIATVGTADTVRRTGICDPFTDASCPGTPSPAIILVENKPVNLDLVFPNVFTPNGDGLNEYFKIAGLESYTAPQLYVYNRWGGQVYASQDYHNDWDGNGGKLNEGTYYYVLKVKTSSDEEKLYKGWVQILK